MSKVLDEIVSEAESVAPWWMKALPYLLVVVVVIGAGGICYHFGESVEHKARLAEVANLQKAQTLQLAAIDRANHDALAALQAKQISDANIAADKMAALDAKHFQELQDANSKADAAVAAARAGTLRVRQRLTCPSVHSDAGASGAAAQAASSPSMGDGTGERGLSQDDIAVVLRIGQRANGISEKLKACQAILSADRLNDMVQP